MGVRCCVMKAYFRADTLPNRIAWGLFSLFIVLGVIFVPLGASRMSRCAGQWDTCVVHEMQRGIPQSIAQDDCKPILYDCNFLDWYRLFGWGILMFIMAGGVLCYFCCCAVPPEYQQAGTATYAVTGTYQVGQPLGATLYESAPLFNAPIYSSVPQHIGYASHHLPPPPPNQMAQMYPAHAAGVQMMPIVPPTYSVTLSPYEHHQASANHALGHDPSLRGNTLLAAPSLAPVGSGDNSPHAADLQAASKLGSGALSHEQGSSHSHDFSFPATLAPAGDTSAAPSLGMSASPSPLAPVTPQPTSGITAGQAPSQQQQQQHYGGAQSAGVGAGSGTVRTSPDIL